jgi:phage baseplate assembly protein W
MAIRRQFIGFSTLATNQSGWTLFDVELIKRDLLNEFMTPIGERVMLPTYGTIIWSLLFEPLTESIQDEIKQDAQRIVKHDTRVAWKSYKLTQFQNGVRLDIQLDLVPFDTVTTLSVEFDRRARERK